MTNRKITAALIATVAVVLIAWDIYVVATPQKGDTISELLRDLSHDWYFVPFMFGGCVAHFFWNRPAEQMPGQRPLHLFLTRALPIIGLVLVRDLVNLAAPLPTFAYANLIALLAGFFVGAKWWPQAMPDEDVDASDESSMI